MRLGDFRYTVSFPSWFRQFWGFMSIGTLVPVTSHSRPFYPAWTQHSGHRCSWSLQQRILTEMDSSSHLLAPSYVTRHPGLQAPDMEK